MLPTKSVTAIWVHIRILVGKKCMPNWKGIKTLYDAMEKVNMISTCGSSGCHHCVVSVCHLRRERVGFAESIL